MSRRLERGTDLWQSLSDIRGAIHVLYPKNIDKLSQWQSHNLGPQVSERDQLGVAWFIDTEINNTSAINFLGASNTNGRVEGRGSCLSQQAMLEARGRERGWWWRGGGG
jgi:hypothetical protein